MSGTKIFEIQKKIRLLKQERSQFVGICEAEVKIRNTQIRQLQEQATVIYPSYFDSKIEKDFILYQEFPNALEVFVYDREFEGGHPIYDFGYFEIRELAVVIRYLYSFWKQKEYEVVTFGYLSGSPLYEPRICFLITDEKGRERYKDFGGCFLKEAQLFKEELRQREKDFIVLFAEDSINSCHELPILAEEDIDFCGKKGIGYYHPITNKYSVHKFCDLKNIFSDCIDWRIYQGIENTLNFPIHFCDRMIAEILISIAIYKKNHRKIYLSNEDYQYIFYQLYGEDVDIQSAIMREIPKVLRYVSKY